MNEPTRIDPKGPSHPRRPSRLAIAIGTAAGFLAGVLLVIVLGGTPTTTLTKTQRVTVTTPPVDATIITRTAVPDLVGETLETAHDRLDAAQFDSTIDSGGGLLGPLDDSNWVVVDQEPEPGTQLEQGSTVHLAIDRG